MSEAASHRRCPVTGMQMLVAPGRKGATAHLALAGSLPELDGPCPFCPDAPDVRDRIVFEADEAGARVLVLPNKFPAVSAQAVEGRYGRAARGHHELVIESQSHDAELATLEDAHVALLFRVLRARVARMEASPEVEHVAVFRNRGTRAGASQPHPHTQVVGAASPGPEQVARLETALRHFARHGAPVSDTLVRRERTDGARIIRDHDGMLSLAAFAPRKSGEVWVLPERARGSLTAFDDASLDAFARAVRDLARAVRVATGRGDYNVVLRNLPVRHRSHPAAFTYAEIVPRGGTVAGFELATGAGIASTTPEALAERVRDVLAQ